MVEFNFIIIIAQEITKMNYGQIHRGHHFNKQSLGRL